MSFTGDTNRMKLRSPFIRCKAPGCVYLNCTKHPGQFTRSLKWSSGQRWLHMKWNTVLEWFRNCCTTVHGSGRIVKGSRHMGKASEIKKKISALEAELAAATQLPSADSLRTGDVFENDEGQGRILVVDGTYFRLVGAKKGQVLRNVFTSKEAVLEHMESNGYSKRA